MPSQRRFEGPVLEALLERVRHETEGARIVAANRVRRGGLGGFFAKEHFEVVVELGTPPSTSASADARGDTDVTSPASAPSPRSVLDLVDATDAQERASNIVDLARAERDPEGGGGDDRPSTISTEGDTFHEMLERLAGAVDAEPGFDALQRVEGRALVERIAANARLGATDPAPDIVPRPPAERESAPAPRSYVPLRVQRATRAAEVIERPENALFRLGVPARFVPRGVAPARLRGALVECLAELPAPLPLPDTTGVVIAVVGVGSRSVAVARGLAAEHALDPDNVVIAAETSLPDAIPSWLQIVDPDSAQERRRSWRRRDHVTFVAVSVPSVSSDRWARGLLDALEPTQVWGVAHAAWKPDDVDAWGARLGGFDVIALEQLADTVSPAAALALDVPVGRIDGAPATPLRWTELLLSRMAAA